MVKKIEDGGDSLVTSETAAKKASQSSAADPTSRGVQEPRQIGLLLRHHLALRLDRLRDPAALQASVEPGNQLQARLLGRTFEGMYPHTDQSWQ